MIDILKEFGQFYHGWDIKASGHWTSKNLRIVRIHTTRWDAYDHNDNKRGSHDTLWQTIRVVEGIPL